MCWREPIVHGYTAKQEQSGSRLGRMTSLSQCFPPIASLKRRSLTKVISRRRPEKIERFCHNTFLWWNEWPLRKLCSDLFPGSKRRQQKACRQQSRWWKGYGMKCFRLNSRLMACSPSASTANWWNLCASDGRVLQYKTGFTFSINYRVTLKQSR